MPAFSPPHVAYAFLAGFDHQAVMVFFVLSGLLVGGSVVREIAATGQVALGPYVLRRLVRLCLVLWPASGSAAVCLAAALGLGAVEQGILPAETAHVAAPSGAGVQRGFPANRGLRAIRGNGALWSLFNEFWYYLLFPPLALALLPGLPPGRRVALGGRHWVCWPG